MAVNVTVPQLGESISEAVVGKWHKKVGDPVKADEPVVVLETDKVTVDISAPAGGSLTAIERQEGDRVKVGEVLGSITPGGISATPSPPPAAAIKSSATPAAAKASAASTPPRTGGAEDGRVTLLTPVARRVAEEGHLDPNTIRGSGISGRILKGDVLHALEGNGQPALRAEVRGEKPPVAASRVEERVKMTPLRRRVAERLVAAQSNAVILTTFNEIDMKVVVDLRRAYQDKFQERHGVRLGFMSFFVRAVIDALQAFPQVNAEIDGDDVVFKRYYDIGVAVSGSRGLVVPVLRDADQMAMAEVERQVAEFANKARTDKLTLDDLRGGTFTITNGGIFGSMLSTPILNPPQTGILGMHHIQERAVVREGQIVIRPIMYVALSYDHRLIDGREAVQFLVRIKECIEDPERLLLGV